ncbi:MAG: winged helix-turn-helix domain-containing protein [Acidobacteriia bacterium]|nr:winged helix-turn-helix domain-containing protein [Terriglobia bacterium]
MMEVLVCLAHHPGETLPKEQLLKTIWPDTFVTDDVLVRSVSEIRRAFEDDPRESKFIQTIPKRGYRLVAPVVLLNGNTGPATEVSKTAEQVKQSVFARRSLRIGVVIGITATIALLAILALMPTDVWRKLAGKGGIPQIRSIAVLPLQNLSGDQTQEYFADAMTEELITELSRLSALKVISRTSVMRYKKTDKRLPEIARELGVDGIVEGSVLRSGDRVRVTAQLIYAPRDSNLWAQTYDRDLSDILTLQSSVASAIAEEIQAKMTPQEHQQLKSLRPVNRKALDSYLEGRFHLGKASDLQLRKGFEQQFADEVRKAIADFELAIREDPHYIPAYLAIFEMQNLMDVTPELDSKGRAAVARAMELDDSVAEAHLDNARLLLFDWKWLAAEKEYKRAIELNPNSADAHVEYANYLDLMAGEHTPAGQEELELAQRLDPVNDRIGESFPAGWSIDQRQQYVDEREPNSWFLRAALGRAFQEADRYKEAVEQYMKTLKLLGYDDQARILQDGYARGDYKGAIRAWLKVYVATSKSHHMPKYFAAWLYGNLGDKEEALALLEQAYKEHDGIMIHLKDDTIWAPIRSDPRFKELIRRVGLPP